MLFTRNEAHSLGVRVRLTLRTTIGLADLTPSPPHRETERGGCLCHRPEASPRAGRASLRCLKIKMRTALSLFLLAPFRNVTFLRFYELTLSPVRGRWGRL